MHNIGKLGLALSAKFVSDCSCTCGRIKFFKVIEETLGAKVMGEIIANLFHSGCYYFQTPVESLDYTSFHLRMELLRQAVMGDPEGYATIAARRVIDMCRPGIDWDRKQAIAA